MKSHLGSPQELSHQPQIVGIDCRLAGRKHAGIGRYIENLIIELSKLPTVAQFDWVLFFHDHDQLEAVLPQIQSNWQPHTVLAPIRHYSMAEQTRWTQLLNRHHLDLLHVPHFNIPLLYQRPLVVTIHDLLWHQQIGPEATTLPPWKYYLKYVGYRFVAKQAIKKAETIFVPTQSIQRTINRYYSKFVSNTDSIQHRSKNSKKIVVTPEGISTSFKQTMSQISQKSVKSLAKIRSNNLIYVGSLYPHKNLNLVLQALPQLPQFKLQVVSVRNVFLHRFKAEVKKQKLESQVEILGYLSDEELVRTLQQSYALVQPSLSEGFGLTGVEAMACGTPVIASDIQVFHEIYQQAPTYIDPYSAADIIQAVNRLQQPKYRQQKIALGFKTAQKYSWSRMAEQVIQHYQRILT